MSFTRVAVIGANGKVGQILTKKLNKLDDYTAKAIIRNPDRVNYFDQLGIITEVISLEDSVSKLADGLKDYDTVVFTAGAGGKGLDKTLSVDLDGAVKVFEAAEKAGVKRFVLVSALNAEDRDMWYDGPLRSYYICKKYADRELKRTNLDWTILQPGELTEGQAYGKVSGGTKGSIDRVDVADTIIAILEDDSTIKKTIPLVKGDTLIKKYLSELK